MRISLKGIALLVGVSVLAACEDAIPDAEPPGRADLAGRWVVEEYLVHVPCQGGADLAFQSTVIMTIALDPSNREQGRIDTSFSPPVNGLIKQRELMNNLTASTFDLFVDRGRPTA